ncbi:MAG: AraC family transcriptional regulator [Holophagaceae bacterium]|nr:AraC family transcriptional regulator [Holophagaceae bacterium]
MSSTVADVASQDLGVMCSRLSREISRSMGTEETLRTAIPGLTLFQQIAPTSPLQFTCQPSLAVVAQGRKNMMLEQGSFVYDNTRFLLTSLDLPAVSRVLEASPEHPYLCMVMNLDLPVVRDLLSQLPTPIASLPMEGPAMATGENTPELIDACCRLVELLGRPEDIPIMGGLVQREIIYRVLVSSAGARLRAIATLGSRNNRLARSIAWIKENYARPLRTEELAKLAGMGVSTFHTHFRELTLMSPLQYQKCLRLHTARSLMLLDEMDAASAAFEVGYESSSQFSRDYRRHFGQPPIRDILGLRSAGALTLDLVSNG